MSAKISPIAKHGVLIQIGQTEDDDRVFLEGGVSFRLLSVIDQLRDEVFERLKSSLPQRPATPHDPSLDYGTRAQP
ncbi:MAG: hypothetical protein Q8O38_16620 [Sulfurimicrobium sp.]|nr:hypothetical protein [Sulfurimicrobium sp.]